MNRGLLGVGLVAVLLSGGCSSTRDGAEDGGAPFDGGGADGGADGGGPVDAGPMDAWVPPDGPILVLDGGTTTCLEPVADFACDEAMCGNGVVDTCTHCYPCPGGRGGEPLFCLLFPASLKDGRASPIAPHSGREELKCTQDSRNRRFL